VWVDYAEVEVEEIVGCGDSESASVVGAVTGPDKVIAMYSEDHEVT